MAYKFSLDAKEFVPTCKSNASKTVYSSAVSVVPHEIRPKSGTASLHPNAAEFIPQASTFIPYNSPIINHNIYEHNHAGFSNPVSQNWEPAGWHNNVNNEKRQVTNWTNQPGRQSQIQHRANREFSLQYNDPKV